MEILLDLSEIQAGYLLSAVSEFYHNMKLSATNEGYVVPGMDVRLVAAGDVWDQVKEQINL